VAALTLIAQLSDPHVEVGPGDGGSTAALEAAVGAVLALDPPPDAVLVSGDLTNDSSARSFERVRELLAPLPMPVHVLPGNHDEREALRAWFTEDEAPHVHGAPFQYAVRCRGVRLVVVDTTLPGRDDGRLDAGARAWLETELAAEPGTPTIVAMHHSPLVTGIPGLDDFGLPAADRAALGAILAGSPQVRRVVGGHVHLAAFGVLGGCAVVSCPSTHLQARVEIGAPEMDLAPGPAGFALHALLDDGEIVSHVQPVA